MFLQDVSPSPEFFYQTSKSVIPVFIGKEVYIFQVNTQALVCMHAVNKMFISEYFAEANSACSGQSRDKEETVGDTNTDNEIR